MLGPCIYKESEHELLTPELLYWCKRQTADPELRRRLFVYHQLQVGTFVIAIWLGAPKREFVDLLNVGTSLRNFNRGMAQRFKKNIYKPTSFRDIKHQLVGSDSDYNHAKNDEQASMQDASRKRARDFGY